MRLYLLQLIKLDHDVEFTKKGNGLNTWDTSILLGRKWTLKSLPGQKKIKEETVGRSP